MAGFMGRNSVFYSKIIKESFYIAFLCHFIGYLRGKSPGDTFGSIFHYFDTKMFG